MSVDQPPARRYQAKEDFVTGHSGTTPHELLLLCLVVPVGLRLYFRLRACVRRRGVGTPDDGRRGGRGTTRAVAWGDVALEFVTLAMPMLVVQTSLLPYLAGPLALLTGMFGLASFVPTPQPTKQRTTTNEEGRRPAYLSIHRSCVYLLTTIAILAVDFPIFPRRFCKTEVEGYGWMDLGASSFVIIAGWTSALSSSGNAGRHSNAPDSAGLARKAVTKCAPLLLIGLIRLATNKGLEYQEHVSEYGVHWNFFFTLCLVEGFVVAWRGVKRRLGPRAAWLPLDGIVALVLMVPYQLFLSNGGQDFIVNGDRRCNENDTTLPSMLVSEFPSLCNTYAANREGILGVVGYFALRLLGAAVARLCLLPSRKTPEKSNCITVRQRRLFVASSISWMAHLCLTEVIRIPNSRRSTNASFVLWSLAHNLSLLCMIHYETTGAPVLEEKTHTPPILEAVNRFGLAVFLSSNILTGLTNLTVDTLHSSDGKAMLVLLIYLVLVCGIALTLDILFKKMKAD